MSLVSTKSNKKTKKKTSADHFLKTVIKFFAIVILIVSISLIAIPFIKPVVVELKNRKQEYHIATDIKEIKGSPEEIKPPKVTDILNYEASPSKEGIGRLVYENQAIDLPLYEELTNNNLMSGVVAMNTERDPLTENFTVIGHNFGYGHTLLSDIVNAKKGDMILLSVLNELYEYKVREVYITPENDVGVLENTSNSTGMLTVITCDIGDITDKRLIIKADLVENSVSEASRDKIDLENKIEGKIATIHKLKTKQLNNYLAKLIGAILISLLIGLFIIRKIFK